MKILITGGAGFIGSNLVLRAQSEGHDIRVVDDLSTGFLQNLRGVDVEFRQESILNQDALSRSMRNVDAVVHLAALGSVPRSIKDPVSTHEVNARGTLNVLLAARDADVGHVSVASSSSVYGLNPAMPKSEREWVRPMSPYAVSKLATEQYALSSQQAYGMSTLAFRFFNVYGPRQRAGHAYAAVIPAFMEALHDGKPLPVNGDGLTSRDFTYVGTVCETLLDAACRQVVHAEPVNLAYGTNTTLLQLIERIAAASGKKPEIEYRDFRPGDVKHSQANNVSLRGLFPNIEPVSLDSGLTATYDWFHKESA